MSKFTWSSYTVTIMEPGFGSNLRVREFLEIFFKTPYSISVTFKYKILKGICDVLSFLSLPPSSLEKESNLQLKRSKGVTYERNLHATADSFTIFISQHLFLQIGQLCVLGN